VHACASAPPIIIVIIIVISITTSPGRRIIIIFIWPLSLYPAWGEGTRALFIPAQRATQQRLRSGRGRIYSWGALGRGRFSHRENAGRRAGAGERARRAVVARRRAARGGGGVRVRRADGAAAREAGDGAVRALYAQAAGAQGRRPQGAPDVPVAADGARGDAHRVRILGARAALIGARRTEGAGQARVCGGVHVRPQAPARALLGADGARGGGGLRAVGDGVHGHGARAQRVGDQGQRERAEAREVLGGKGQAAVERNHVVEAVGPRPGFLAEAVGNPAGNAAASWLFVFFLVNHFENLSFFWLITSKI